MNKLMERMKKNNKGFTLVELIVVIAILAIITVVVAPMYLNYVEKSRVATDENAIGEIAHAAEIAVVDASADPTKTIPATSTVTIKIGDAGACTITADASIQTELNAIIANDSYVFKSKKYKGTDQTITVNGETGSAKWNKPTE